MHQHLSRDGRHIRSSPKSFLSVRAGIHCDSKEKLPSDKFAETIHAAQFRNSGDLGSSENVITKVITKSFRCLQARPTPLETRSTI